MLGNQWQGTESLFYLGLPLSLLLALFVALGVRLLWAPIARVVGPVVGRRELPSATQRVARGAFLATFAASLFLAYFPLVSDGPVASRVRDLPAGASLPLVFAGALVVALGVRVLWPFVARWAPVGSLSRRFSRSRLERAAPAVTQGAFFATLVTGVLVVLW